MNTIRGFRRAALVAGALIFTLAVANDGNAQKASNLVCKGCVQSRDLSNKSVTRNKIRNNSVTGSKISNKAVTGPKIRNNAVTGSKIRNGSVSSSKLAANAKPTGVEFEEAQDQNLSTTASIIASVDVTAPANGYIFASASGYAKFDTVAGSFIRCGLTTGITVPTQAVLVTGDQTAASQRAFIGQTTVFEVAAGTTTINWVCVSSVAIDTSAVNQNLAVLFTPNRY